MILPVALIVLIAACGSDPSIHDVGTCSESWGKHAGRNCERACVQKPYNHDMQPADIPGERCSASHPANPRDELGEGGELCLRVSYSDGLDPDHRGCCVYSQKDGYQFFECCATVETDAGVRYVCPG